jgi:hypothetical protein
MDASKTAIYSAVLAANGRLEEARDISKHVRLNDLRIEEKALLREFLGESPPNQ